MNDFIIIKGYKADQKIGQSLSDLANLVFGINLGNWNEQYIPFSYVKDNKVVANVSINVLNLIVKGQKKRALQIGTVMTHPDYRNRGLSTRLMEIILEEYENKYDYMYLFANQNVLNFYPKFGFKRVNEYQFYLDYSTSNYNDAGLRKLNTNNTEDVKLINKYVSERVPVSQFFDSENAQGLLMFYCLYIFNNDIYLIEDEEAIVIFKKDENRVNIFDIISNKQIKIENILPKIVKKDINRIIFHYTPDYKGVNIKSDIFNGSEVLFVKVNGENFLPEKFKHPITSQA
jgi:predicted N-acetyltransferase YhbS